MRRLRIVLGLIAGTIIVLSRAAHSFLGWSHIQAALVAEHVPADQIQGLATGWHFGGGAMLAFGCIVLGLFVERLRGHAVTTWPALVIAALYLVSGVWAMAVNRNPFFLI